MEVVALQARTSNVLDVAVATNFLAPARELLDTARIGFAQAGYLVSARWQMARIVTDRLTPWLEPYHPPVDHL